MATEYSVSVLLKLVDRLTNPLGGVSKKMQDFAEKMRGVGEKMTAAGQKMSLFVTAPLLLAGKAAIQTAGEFEKNKIALESMLGSADKAKMLLNDLVQFAATTPFQLPGLIEGSKQLLAFGIPAGDIIDKLRNLGNIAQGDQSKLAGLTEAFGKIRAKGTASMKEINMMINAGVPIMRALSQEFGVAEEEIFEMTRTGALSFEKIDKAITNLSTGSGMFAGILEKQSRSLLGLWSTLQDNVSLLGKEIAETFMPVLKDIVNWAMGIVMWFRSLSDGTKKLIGTILALAAAIGPLLLIGGKLIMLLATGLGPIGLIIAGFMALSAIIVGVSAAIDGYNNRFANSAKIMKENREEANRMVDEYKELQEKTSRTQEEQFRFLKLQRDLKTAFGDNILKLNEYSGELEINTEHFKTMNKQWVMLEVKGFQSQLEDINIKLGKSNKLIGEYNEQIKMIEEDPNGIKATIHIIEEQAKKELDSMNVLNDKKTALEDMIAEYLKAIAMGDDFADTENKLGDEVAGTNKNLKTLAELLDEIDAKTKQKIVGELLKGKEHRTFRTIDVIKKFEAMQSKTKVDVAIKVEAEEGTSAKISKIEKTGEDANISVNTESYIGMHQYAL